MQARRSMAVSALGTLIACAGASLVHAQGYPAKPIRFVVGFTAGGASDITARIVGQKLTEHFGQPVVIDNRAGASGTIAGGIVAKAPPDGYTLLAGATSILAINPGLYAKLDYDPLRDFAPVSQTVSMPQLLVVHPSVKAMTLKELLARYRDEAGRTELFVVRHRQLEPPGDGIVQVHDRRQCRARAFQRQRTSNAQPARRTGATRVRSDTALPHVKSGRLRAIAISTAARSPAIPDLPTVAEAVCPA